jgi:hypothetical protein
MAETAQYDFQMIGTLFMERKWEVMGRNSVREGNTSRTACHSRPSFALNCHPNSFSLPHPTFLLRIKRGRKNSQQHITQPELREVSLSRQRRVNLHCVPTPYVNWEDKGSALLVGKPGIYAGRCLSCHRSWLNDWLQLPIRIQVNIQPYLFEDTA